MSVQSCVHAACAGPEPWAASGGTMALLGSSVPLNEGGSTSDDVEAPRDSVTSRDRHGLPVMGGSQLGEKSTYVDTRTGQAVDVDKVSAVAEVFFGFRHLILHCCSAPAATACRHNANASSAALASLHCITELGSLGTAGCNLHAVLRQGCRCCQSLTAHSRWLHGRSFRECRTTSCPSTW